MVTVRYHRPGKNTREWEQRLLADNEKMIVSSFEFRLSKPFSPIGNRPLIKDGYYGVLFDLLNRWFNVVKVFDREKNLVGYYSDIRTPPKRFKKGYQAKDLFIDFWVEIDGTYHILDRKEFEEAEIDDSLNKRVEETIKKIKTMIEEEKYPPDEIFNYELTKDEIGE